MTYQRTRENIEAAYQEIIHVITETRNKYLAQISQIIREYEQCITEAMQNCYQNVWKGADFHPTNFTDMVWRHIPGEELNLGISCQVQVRTEHVERLFDVQIFGRKGSVLIPEPVFRGQAKRNLTNSAVTDLLTRIARELFPTTPADKRYIQLAVNSSGIAFDARFLGFTYFSAQEWKHCLLPNFAAFDLKPNSLCQISLKPADAEITEMPENDLEGEVVESRNRFSLVLVPTKGLLAVPGCLIIQTRRKIVRNVFIEASDVEAVLF
jgi:hypothetical protein